MKYYNVPLGEDIVEEIDERRGFIKRASYIRALVKKAWEQGLEVEGKPPKPAARTKGRRQ